MRLLLLAAVALALLAPAATAGKDEVVAKIEALLEKGELEEARSAIDHYLAHNPKDADLLRLLDAWRIRRSGVGPLLEEKGLAEPANRARLREVCWRIVAATVAGNQEEWGSLADLLDGPDRVKAEQLFERLGKVGTDSDRELIQSLTIPRPTAPPDRRKYIQRLKQAKSRDEALRVLRDAELVTALDNFKPYAWKVLTDGDDPELRFAAAAVLLVLRDEGPRKILLGALRSEKPVEAAEAAKVLLRHPAPTSPRPRQKIFERIDESEDIGRAKPVLLSLTIEAIARYGEEGAYEFLVELLHRPDLATDAARAVGALGNPDAVPALLTFLTDPQAEEDTTGGGLGYLDRATGAANTAEEMRPKLVGALAILTSIDNEN